MPQLLDTDLHAAVEDAAAHLYVWALKDIPQDLRDALRDAAGRETSVPGQRVLSTILRNVEVADSERKIEIPLPSDQDMDRVMSFLQRAWKRLVDMANQMQKDVSSGGKI